MKRMKSRARKRKKTVYGTPDRPRLSVFRSNKHIYAQLIDDTTSRTITSASTLEDEVQTELKKADNKTEFSEIIGKRIAEKSKDAGIETVVFDRNGYRYHGRVKALAEAARKAGLKF